MSGTIESDSDSCADEAAMICASCGNKDDVYTLKLCTACRSVRYCNRQCQIRHRPQHKAECTRLAKNERLVNQLVGFQLGMQPEEVKHVKWMKREVQRIKGFIPPPPPECPLCAHLLPLDPGGSTFNPCCGQVICFGCESEEHIAVMNKDVDIFNVKEYQKHAKCSFCRTPKAMSVKENQARALKRSEKGNLVAMRCVADAMKEQEGRLEEAIALYQKAADAGDWVCAHTLGVRYLGGFGVKKNEKKGLNLLKRAANGGLVAARHNIGGYYYHNGNFRLAMAHYSVAAKGGSKESMEEITRTFIADEKERKKSGENDNLCSKEEYTDILRSFQEAREGLDSVSRSRAKMLLGVNVQHQ